MATVVRLKRAGTNKKAFYRIVVADERSPRDGRFIEELGWYDPKKKPHVVKLNKEKAGYWKKTGARLSPTVRNIFKKEGI